MSLLYRRVDRLLSASAEERLEEGDYLLVERGGMPGRGDLVLVRVNGMERVCRWRDGIDGEVVGVVIGIRKRL